MLEVDIIYTWGSHPDDYEYCYIMERDTMQYDRLETFHRNALPTSSG
jgi:hypothetical protein